MDREQLQSLIAECCRDANFQIEQHAATFTVRFANCDNLDPVRLADKLGAIDLGAWQIEPGTLEIDGLDRRLLLIAEQRR